MNYNFDDIQPRRGTHSVKWDASKVDDVLPMWIADMDFGTFPPVVEALLQAVKQGHYGYNTTPDAFYEAIILWWQKRHQYAVQKEWILPTTGVVAGLSAIIAALLEPGDEIIIQTPAYNHFYNLIKGARCVAVENEL